MDLIDRYLVAVRRQLPQHLQNDIIPELGDSLRSEAEEHEQRAGHPMTEAEQAALLKKRGHPWLMASRYLPQQQLIGPALFPYYRQALKIVVFWVVLPIVLFGGAMHAIYSADPSAVWGRVLGSAWNGAIYAVGIVTIVFAILDHEKLRITVLDSWKPENLPEPQPGRPIPRSETIMGLVFALTFLIWWIDLVRVPDFWFYAGESVRLNRRRSGGALLSDPRLAHRQRRRLPDRSRSSVAHHHGLGRRSGDQPRQRGDHHRDSPRRPLRGRLGIRRTGRGPGAGRRLAQHHHRRGVPDRRRGHDLRGAE